MKKETSKKDKHLLKIEDLRNRLAEAEETLRAIRQGEVDALVTSGPLGDQVFTLKSADYPYRVFVEAMHEGAVTLDPDGTILYCNRRFSELIQIPLKKLIGTSIHQLIEPGNLDTFESAFQRREKEDGKAEIYLKRKNGPTVPALLSFNLMGGDEGLLTCMVVTNLTEQKQTQAALAESEKQMRFLATQLLETQEKERKRIALEIHDVLGSSLAAIKFKVEEALHNRSNDKATSVTESLEGVIPLVLETIEDVRRIQSDLRPPTLDDLGNLATLSWFCRRFETIYSGTRIESKFEIREDEIPNPLKIIIFRVVQEALNNISKHTKADLVQLSLFNKDGRRIELTIEDNGKGFDPKSLTAKEPSKRGLGLASMKERTEISGGSFSIESAKGKGTVVKASWPI